jgi:hypothetical protein
MTPEPSDPSDLTATCPECGLELWAERRGQWTLKAAILRLTGQGRFVAKCPAQGCRGEVLVPWLQAIGVNVRPIRRLAIRLDKPRPIG